MNQKIPEKSDQITDSAKINISGSTIQSDLNNSNNLFLSQNSNISNNNDFLSKKHYFSDNILQGK